MLRLLILSTVQSLLLVSGQIFLKFALAKMLPFSWTWPFFRSALFNWQFSASGLSMASASLLWFYILRHHNLSIAYPLISISYIFGLLASVLILHEPVPPIRWLGVLLIMAGVTLLTR